MFDKNKKNKNFKKSVQGQTLNNKKMGKLEMLKEQQRETEKVERLNELKSQRKKAIWAVCTLGIAANPFASLKRISNKITGFFGSNSHLVQGMLFMLFFVGIPIVLLIALIKNIVLWINCQTEISKLEPKTHE